jgi:hypothetical protein
MTEIIRLGDIEIEVTRKAIKHAHLSVHPPNGRVTLVAPSATRLEVARLRDRQARLDSGAAVEASRTSSRSAAEIRRAGVARSLGTPSPTDHSLPGGNALRSSRPSPHHPLCAPRCQLRQAGGGHA